MPRDRGGPRDAYTASDLHRDRYTVEGVERLLGMYEEDATDGHRDVTVLDLLSRANDPGGMQLVNEDDPDIWMARRGLIPHSEAALVLWDFLRAWRRLGREPSDMRARNRESRALFLQAVTMLRVAGFSNEEIAEVLDPDSVVAIEPWMDDRERRRVVRILNARTKRIGRILDGRPKRDAQGNELRHPWPRCQTCGQETCTDHEQPPGPKVIVGGIASRLARLMNGESREAAE